ncbi:MAG: hypothetical protein U0N10_00570 [Bacilli bacterium]
MSKIQLITYNIDEFSEYDNNIDVNNFNALKALDNYDINVIDLSSFEIWANRTNIESRPSTDSKLTADFNSIHQMIKNSKKSKIIICLPQNIYYKCIQYKTENKIQLKNMIPVFTTIIHQLVPIGNIDIVYENSDTTIGTESIEASFYFNNPIYRRLLISNGSEKTTAIESERIILTTLNLIRNDNPDLLYMFLNEIGIINSETQYPEWIYMYSFNDDEIQNNNIEQAKEQIKLQKEIIEKANQKLQQNLHFKSILYNNSSDLVNVVFEILEYIFEVSLVDFNDEKKEDFLFVKDDVTFIGEIKGVTSNVKYEHISQLEVHYSKYLDELQEKNKTEQIKKLLIINYERTKDIRIRDDINKMQIDLAKKNETLIIDTKSLLMMYERILQNKLKKSNVIKYIINSNGLIEIDKIDDYRELT